MRKKRVWRYYCDYCKKSGCSAYHIRNHESHCTNNPNRNCGMCNAAGGYQHSIKDLVKALGKGDQKGLDNLRDLAEGCPACMLAAIRQSGLLDNNWIETGKDQFGTTFELKYPEILDWDFKKEKEDFWAEVNTNNAENGYYY